VDPLGAMPPQDALVLQNLVPGDLGVSLRKGYVEWAKNIGGGNPVRSVIPFDGQPADGSEDRLFCTTQVGIFDVSAQGTDAPANEITPWVSVTSEAGFGVYTQLTSDNGETWLFYADGEHGLHSYRESTDTWAAATGFTYADGVTPFPVADVRFVLMHKQRLWVALKDQSDVYYTETPAAVAGNMIKFTMGSKYVNGGLTVGMYAWTIDGGDGVDDYFVSVSRAGDVLVYRGADPTTDPNWSLVGSWFIGEIPNTRRIAAEYGGDLYLLSSYGLTSVRDLLSGVESASINSSPSRKIAPLLRPQIRANIDRPEWQIIAHPGDALMLIATPYNLNQENSALQYVQHIDSKAWGTWLNVPINCAAPWVGEMYFGTKAGQVFKYTGTVDGSLLDGTPGIEINFGGLTSFHVVGDPTVWKRMGMVRSMGNSSADVFINMKSVYDYNVQSNAPAPASSLGEPLPLWDSAIWDSAVWAGGVTGSVDLRGGSNMGRMMAVAFRGYSNKGFTLASFDISWTQGGYL